MLNFSSLLLATGLSGASLSLTILAIWFSARSSAFVLTTAIGILVLVGHIVAFWAYANSPAPWLCQLALALMVLGFFIMYCAAEQYFGKSVHLHAVAAMLAVIVSVGAITYAGLDGAGFMVAYAAVTVLLAATALTFWLSGTHDRGILFVVSLLTGSCAVSFALCGIVLAANGQWVLGAAPDNWAEHVNTVISVACMTVLGALTLSLHHAHSKALLEAETVTDPLTGLMNRRALANLYGGQPLGSLAAIAVFDLDHFKKTNDVFGHPVGDLVLKRFAYVVQRQIGEGAKAFRLGGEEFVVVMPNVSRERARNMASRITVAFGTEVVSTPLGPLRSSVSGGVGFGGPDGSFLDQVMAEADAALYEAKRLGRNRVVLSTEPDFAEQPARHIA